MANAKSFTLLCVLIIVTAAEDSPTSRFFGFLNSNVTSTFCNYFCGNSVSTIRSSKTFQLCSTKCPPKSNITNLQNDSSGLVQTSNTSPGLGQAPDAFPGLVQTSVITSSLPLSMTITVMNQTGFTGLLPNTSVPAGSKLILEGNESDSADDLFTLSLEGEGVL